MEHPLPPKDGPLRWAETQRLIRTDFARLVALMGGNATLSNRVFWFFLPSYQGLLHYRLYRHAYVNGWRRLAGLMFLVTQYLVGVDIPPATSIGEACLLGHRPIALSGLIGRHFTMMGQGAIGGGLDSRDIGGGPGLPVIGDNVRVSIGVSILGPVRIGDGARVGPAATVTRDVPAGAMVIAPTSRIAHF